MDCKTNPKHHTTFVSEVHGSVLLARTEDELESKVRPGPFATKSARNLTRHGRTLPYIVMSEGIIGQPTRNGLHDGCLPVLCSSTEAYLEDRLNRYVTVVEWMSICPIDLRDC